MNKTNLKTSPEIEEIEWRPEFSAEDQAQVDEYRKEFDRAGSLFRSIREQLGLTQVEAAARLGTTQANVSKVERRKSTDVSQIEKLVADSGYEVLLVLRNDKERREFSLSKVA